MRVLIAVMVTVAIMPACRLMEIAAPILGFTVRHGRNRMTRGLDRPVMRGINLLSLKPKRSCMCGVHLLALEPKCSCVRGIHLLALEPKRSRVRVIYLLPLRQKRSRVRVIHTLSGVLSERRSRRMQTKTYQDQRKEGNHPLISSVHSFRLSTTGLSASGSQWFVALL